MAGTSVPAALK